MRITVILPAAGLGRRFAESPQPTGPTSQGSVSKLECDLAGRPVFLRAIELFIHRPEVGRVILATNPDTIDDFKIRWGDQLGFLGIEVVAGGTADRWETVFKALDAVPQDTTHLAIHDAARPLTSARLIDRVFEAATRFDAVIPAVALNGTIKRVAADPGAESGVHDPADRILDTPPAQVDTTQRVTETVDRTGLVEVQTPQVFQADLLRRAYAGIAAGRVEPGLITDDAALVEALGEPVRVVDGEAGNIKITRAEDLPLAEGILASTHATEPAELARRRLFADDED